MNLEEYEKSGRALYERFAATVAAILRAALDEAPEIKVQQVQHRAKDVSSLAKKLAARSHDAAKPIQSSAKDLAGCRIVVYSNDDVTRIANSRLLVDNFEVDWERTRVHQPGVADGASQFIANNYVVKLKDDRAGLPEYRAYTGLWCEVQLQTILNHAWAATAHDTIYKQSDLDGIGQAHMARINRRMTKIMEDYLKPAGFEFQKVLDDFERMAAGKQLIDTEILKAIRDATDNNQRDRLIEQFRENVLPLYDDPSKVYPEIRATMLEAVEAGVGTETVPLETGIGLMRGRTPEDVMRRAVDVLDDLRYVDVGATFNAYVTLFASAASDVERKTLRDAVGRLAHYLLPVWRNHGPAAQILLLDAIEALDPATRNAARPLITEASGQCLDSDITGTTSTSTIVSWHTAAVVPTERLASVRDRAKAILSAQLALAAGDDEWRDIVSALGHAARLPHQAGYGDDLLIRAMADSAANVDVFTDQLQRMPNFIRQGVELDVFWLHRRFADLPDNLLAVPGVTVARDALVTAIQKFRTHIDAIEDFQIFKILVGFQSVYPYQWDHHDLDYQRKETYRDEQMAALLLGVTPNTAEEWYKRLNRYAGTQSNEGATFPSLGSFVSMIAEAQPDIVESWLSRPFDAPLASFRPGMFIGLQKTKPDTARALATVGVKQAAGLSGVMKFLRHAEPTDAGLLEEGLQTAMAANDAPAVYYALEAACARTEDIGHAAAARLCLGSVSHFDANEDSSWIEPLALWGIQKGLVAALSDAEMRAILAALVHVPKVDYRAEQILGAIASRLPHDVIGFFGDRIAYDRVAGDDNAFVDGDTYEALPFQFQTLTSHLADHCAAAVDAALDWSRGDIVMSEFRGGKFIAIAYPSGPNALRDKLMQLAGTRLEAEQAFIFKILANMEGRPFAFPIIREIVATAAADSPLLRQARIVLHASGVMHGEFGYRDKLINIKEQIGPWLNDERPAVVQFATAFLASLDNDIALAQRQAEEDIAKRRLDYGEPLREDDDERHSEGPE